MMGVAAGMSAREGIFWDNEDLKHLMLWFVYFLLSLQLRLNLDMNLASVFLPIRTALYQLLSAARTLEVTGRCQSEAVSD
nr:hypothetical protein BaRGS_010981 [Batillaria attramentaria]